MCNRLDRKKNQVYDFSDLYFSSYDYFCTPIAITRKIDIPFVSAHSASSVKTGSRLRGGGRKGGLHILNWEIPYTSYSFEIERNIIVATFFCLIISQTEFRLFYNQKEIIRTNHHIPFNLKRIKKHILLSVCLYVTTTARL